MKGVILAGGTGSRLYPLTRITNKHLLPIYDRPMICYAIQALVKAGIEDVVLVTGGTHAGEFFRLLGDGSEFGIRRLFYTYQETPGGIAQALSLANHVVDNDLLVVMLADNLFESGLRPAVDAFVHQGHGARVVLAPLEDVGHLRHLGVVEFGNDGTTIKRIQEKPAHPPSLMAVTGVYFYDSSVFEVIATLQPSVRDELEITDVNNHFIQQGSMQYDVIEGFWGDAGESIDAYYAVNDFVRGHARAISEATRTSA